MEDKYEIVTTTIGDLRDGDEVIGSDGKWHAIEILPVVMKYMHKVHTSAGSVICSFDHEWNLCNEDEVITIRTSELLSNEEEHIGKHIGETNGPIFEGCEAISEPMECRCIAVDSEDRQFQIFTDAGEPILTHNCAARMVCGRLDTVASQMALDSTLATSIDGSHKGAGIVSVNGVKSNIQYYFEGIDWIDKWFEDHGFDKNGYLKGHSEEEISYELSGEEELDVPETITHFEFDGNEKNINNSKKQEFKNV